MREEPTDFSYQDRVAAWIINYCGPEYLFSPENRKAIYRSIDESWTLGLSVRKAAQKFVGGLDAASSV